MKSILVRPARQTSRHINQRFDCVARRTCSTKGAQQESAGEMSYTLGHLGSPSAANSSTARQVRGPAGNSLVMQTIVRPSIAKGGYRRMTNG
jgi:hypothetical protein